MQPLEQQLSLFTLEAARTEFRDRLRAGEHLTCPCCDRYAQVYHRKIHATMSSQLIKFYKLGGDRGWVHTSKIATRTGTGDFGKFKNWDLIISKGSGAQHYGKENGLWTLTSKGIGFIFGEIAVPKVLTIYSDKVIAESLEQVSIQETLGDKFNYQQLMEQFYE